MSFLKNAAFSAANTLDVNFLKKHTPLEVFIPFHHVVSNEPVRYIEPLYKFKNTRQFESDLDYLLKNFNPVSLTDLVVYKKSGEPLPKKSFLITFDDALKQVYDVAMPILLKKGVPAALFIVPPFLDNKELFYDLKKGLILDKLINSSVGKSLITKASSLFNITTQSIDQLIKLVKSINYLNRDITGQLGQLLDIDFELFLSKEKPFMTSEQVTDFIKKGFHVGAHSMTHPLYSLISLEQQISQTVQSMRWVSEKFDIPYKAFGFPHVDTGVSKTFFDEVVNAGQATRPDIIFGNTTGMLDANPLVLHRFIGENPGISIEKSVKAIMLFSIIKSAFGKQFVSR